MKKNMKKILIIVITIILIISGIFVYIFYNYEQGKKCQLNKDYEKAISYYNKVKFVPNKVKEKEEECYYQRAIELRDEKDYDNSILYFEKSNNYNDSQEQIKETKYKQAINKYENGDFEKSKEIFGTIQDYKDVSTYLSNTETMINLQGIWKHKEGLSNWVYEISGWKINQYTKFTKNDYRIGKETYSECGKNKIEIKDKNIEIVYDKTGNRTPLKYEKENNSITDDIIGTYIKQEGITVEKLKKPKIGMTKDEVINSTWGKPEDINKTTTRYGTSEQWCYSGYKYIYFEDGIVTSIQD